MLLSTRTLLLVITMMCWVFSSRLTAQSFYSPSSEQVLYSPLEGTSTDTAPVLNPAAMVFTGNRATGYMLRTARASTYESANDQRTKTKTTLAEEGYGASALFDLGAGMSAGASYSRLYSKADISQPDFRLIPYEIQATQTISGRLVIEVAVGLKVGILLRWINQDANIMGNINSSPTEDRIQYKAHLIGHGAGFNYQNDRFRLGGVYIPAARGKAEIIYEQRIITEPGVALFDAGYKVDNWAVGLATERTVHRRDERAVTVLSEDGNRNVTLDGASPDRNALSVSAYHASVEYKLAPIWVVRAGVTLREKEMVFDGTRVPGDIKNADRYNQNELKACLAYTGRFEVMAGFQTSSFSKTLTAQSGAIQNGAIYSGNNKVTFLSIGSKF
jgi:hypothetical protein